MRRLRPLLGTYVEIEAQEADRCEPARAIAEAFDAVALVHRLMSVHEPDSDLSRLNRDAWRSPVGVHPWTARALKWALAIHAETGGLFDCAVGHQLARRGLRRGCGFDDAEPGSMADVELRGDGRVSYAHRIGLDFGGIAKGFAVDRAVATLRRHGVRSAIVNAGGDLRVLGREPRPIHLRDPLDPRRLRFAGFLGNGAIATSETATLVPPHRGSIAADARSYSVLAPTCVAADALTKALALSGRTDAPWLARFGATALITAPLAQAA